MTKSLLSTVALAVSLALTGCSGEAPVNQSPSQQQQAPTLSSGIELHNMDTSVAPQQNFFRFVNGNWLERTEIPADRARWGSFDELREVAEQHVLDIILELAEGQHAQNSDAQKIADLFRSFLDTETIESLGLMPLQPELDRISALQSHADLAKLWGEWQHIRSGVPMVLFVGQDQRQSDQYITAATQSGLGMPDRDYYLKDDERSLQILQEYQNLIQRFWQLAGWEQGEQAAETILAIERQLAEAQWSRIQNRDRNATYNKMTPAELAESAPGFDWASMLTAAQLADIDALVIRQPSYFTDFAALQQQIPLSEWQDYLRFHLLRSSASMLPSAFDDASFDFFGRVLSGQQEQRSREKRAVQTTEQMLGFLVGQKYVERHFQPEAKARMDEMVQNFMVAFSQAIDELEWMSDATKAEAQAKLASFNTKIGYPDVWRDYDCVTIAANDLLGNARRSAQCEYERMIGRLGQPVNRDEWGMTPQTVNAYYSSTMNEIVFPAAILQPPFFDVIADDALNYGAIGAVIGHEITHGFDDQGRRSDGEGNLRDWWTEEDERQFRERAQLMIDQFNAFNPIDDLHLQGALGLGENIADLGGLTVGYRAYQNSLQGQPAPVIDGFTGSQRFFIGWGQIWRIKFRDEALRQQVITGPHSPGKYRVLGPLSNMPEFYQAFDVQPGDGMYREEAVRVKIW
ncbi:M13 family metallopeptidase [Alkalimonas delamerensis]|uniref:M13 family metallopeptidase n=1 Tax=Alkalimonas delamerensis TaxID=265981 RepID=A0ABT9GT26_9GAMM|nr:M13 family metallopeptidase [Alkalimonas delamerensis]MDP4530129.1 M13 family metallopeptidase [Alkalimonas delamerensis]